MGVRFACHVCGKRLNIKTELAGRRGKCPACGQRFRIPTSDQELSIVLDDVDQITGQTVEGSSVLEAPAARGSEVSRAALGAGSDMGIADASSRSGLLDDRAGMSNGKPMQWDAESLSRALKASGLIESPQMLWYIRPPAGEQYGPADGDCLLQWFLEGRVSGNSYMWREDWPQWRTVSDALDLHSAQDNPPIAPPDSTRAAEHRPGATQRPAGTPNRPTGGASSGSRSSRSATSQTHSPGSAEESSPRVERSTAVNSQRNRHERQKKRSFWIAVMVGVSVLLLIGLVVAIAFRSEIVAS